MVQNTEKYTVITGASSGIGYETAKAFAERGSSLILVARRKDRLETLRQEILALHPMLDIMVKAADLTVPQKCLCPDTFFNFLSQFYIPPLLWFLCNPRLISCGYF